MPLLAAEVLFTKDINKKAEFYSLHSCPTPHNTCMYLHHGKHKLDINRQLFPQMQSALFNRYHYSTKVTI